MIKLLMCYFNSLKPTESIMKKLSLLNAFLAIVACFLSATVFSQQAVNKYYDKDWAETTQNRAAYHSVFTPKGQLYECVTYYGNTDKIKSVSMQKDTVRGVPVGLQMSYYKNGKLEDSSYIADGVDVEYSYHYYRNGSLHARFVKGDASHKEIIEGYDEAGMRIKKFVFQREAEFKGGDAGWAKYISKKAALTKDILESLAQENPEEKQVSLIIKFAIDTEGYVTKAKVVESSGHKIIDNYALDVINSSPRWKPAIMLNERIVAYRLQPFKYLLQ